MTASHLIDLRSATAAHAARGWAHGFALRLAITDTVAVGAAVLAAQLMPFSASEMVDTRSGAHLSLTTAQTSLALAVVWLLALTAVDSRDRQEIGAGPGEYRRVIGAAAATFGITLLASFFLGLELSRFWVLTVFPLGLLAVLAGRWAWRKWLVAERRAGRCSYRVVLIGSRASVARTAADLARNAGHGYRVVGVALTDGPAVGQVGGLPIIGAVDDVPRLLGEFGADTVLATSSDHLSPERVRDLVWQLEPTAHRLVVAPSLTDIGGSRIRLRPTAGLPLITVETPHYSGSKRFLKRGFDIVTASAMLIVLAPVLALIAIAVHRDSPGGVFYAQDRVGKDGELFRILKFRSMVSDADVLRAALVAQSSADARRFKLAADPRVTRVGRVLRKYSLDELPQLFNVLRGDMSLVGPRPALPCEVSEYSRRELRRLAVTPGLSGLWQVSGRSDLDWADGVRLDLYYVENWSLTQDIVILWRTMRAVFRSEGAY